MTANPLAQEKDGMSNQSTTLRFMLGIALSALSSLHRLGRERRCGRLTTRWSRPSQPTVCQ